MLWHPRKARMPEFDTMSALPPKAGIERHDWHVRFVPQAVISRSLFNHLVDLRKQRR